MNRMFPVDLFKKLIKANALKNGGRILGLAVGTKYVGVAVSDVNNKIALPLRVLLREKSNIPLVASDLQSLISQYSSVALIVGYPYSRQHENQNAWQVESFIHDLNDTGKLGEMNYAYWDGSFSTKNAELLAQHLNLDYVQSRPIFDKLAAAIVLQRYLDFVNRNESLKSLQGKDKSS